MDMVRIPPCTSSSIRINPTTRFGMKKESSHPQHMQETAPLVKKVLPDLRDEDGGTQSLQKQTSPFLTSLEANKIRVTLIKVSASKEETTAPG